MGISHPGTPTVLPGRAPATSGEQPLRERTALVTGASRGVGLEIARRLVHAGAQTFLLARSAAALAREAASLGPLATPLACDLGRSDQVANALALLKRVAGDGVDILVQNAGVFPLAMVGALPVETFAQTLDVNLLAPYRLVHELLPGMRARKSGHIVTIGSIADHVALPGNAAYAASKYGARAVHEVMREELRGSGVRVTLVSPGPVNTPLWDEVDPDAREGFTPRARMLQPEAVADAVLFAVTRPPEVDIEEIRLARS